jgi:hypothetical protein
MTARPLEESSTSAINQEWTPAYQEAQHQGKTLMYVCRQGLRRSQSAAEETRDIGEINTTYLEGGIQGLHNPTDVEPALRTDAYARSELVKLAENNYLRFIQDEFDANAPELPWLHQQLAILEQEGRLKKTDYEFVTSHQIIQELLEHEKKRSL